MTPGRASTRSAGALAALVLLAVLLQARTLAYPFVLDDVQILANPDLRSPGRIGRLLGRGWWEGTSGTTQGDQYRPLTTLSLGLSFALGGERPAAFRLPSLLLHGLATWLAVLVGTRLLGSRALGWLAGLYHATLPVHADTVVGIIHRSELLATTLALGAWLLHPRSAARAPWGAAALYALAVLAKESAAALPAALLALDRAARPELGWSARDLVRRYGPYALGLAACLALRVAVLGRVGLVAEARYFPDQSALVVVLTMAQFAWIHCARPLLAGMPLILDFSRRSFPDASPASPAAWIAAIAWLGVLGAAAWLAWRRRSPAASGVCAAFLLALPVSNLVVRTAILGAHRALYLPSLGLSLALAASVGALKARHGALGRAAAALLVAAAAVHAVQSVARGSLWRDELTLARATVAAVPDNALALELLGHGLVKQGQAGAALAPLRRALERNPASFSAAANLAGALDALGRYDEALHALDRARARSPLQQGAVHALRGSILGRRGRPGDLQAARAEARRAVEIDPGTLSHRVGLAILSAAAGHVDEAGRLLDEVARAPARTRADEEARRLARRLLDGLEVHR